MNRMKQKTTSLLLAAGLMLGVWKEHVALFCQPDPEPVEIYPYRLEVLPPADQQALSQGIQVPSQQELNRLLQDFLS